MGQPTLSAHADVPLYSATISPKMAASGRVHLLLLLMSVPFCLRTVQGLKAPSGNGNGLGNPPPNPPVPVNIIGAPGPVNNVPVAPAVAAMTQPRRATGWKLAEEQSCRDDLTRLCPKHTWSNNLAVLECLQDRKEVKRDLGGGDVFCSRVCLPAVVCVCVAFRMSMRQQSGKAHLESMSSFHIIGDGLLVLLVNMAPESPVTAKLISLN